MKKPKFYRLFDYNKNLLPNKHLAMLEKRTKNYKNAKEITGFSVGYPAWNVIYYLIITSIETNQKNVNILETGTNYGSTTIILAQALKDLNCKNSKAVSIEILKENILLAKQNLKKAKLNNYVKFILGDAKKILSKKIFNKIPNKIDFAFLDGSHLENDVLIEFEQVYNRLQKNSLIVFDNIYPIAEPNEDQRVYGALKYIKKKYKNIQIIDLPYCSWHTPGIAIMQKKI